MDEALPRVDKYLDDAFLSGMPFVRIIHGKGIGVQRTIVQKVLQKHPAVESFGHPTDGGSWGATVVRLRGEDG